MYPVKASSRFSFSFGTAVGSNDPSYKRVVTISPCKHDATASALHDLEDGGSIVQLVTDFHDLLPFVVESSGVSCPSSRRYAATAHALTSIYA